MTDHGVSSNLLAEQVNRAIGDLTGKPGGVDGSTVRDWRAGRVRWPKTVTRIALQQITGLTALELGFIPRGKSSSTPSPQLSEEGDPVKRRRFIAAGTGLAAGITSAAPFTLGASDVQRLQDDLGNLLRLDDQNGGGPELERRAVSLSDHAVSLQTTGRATTRIRSRLYSLAASFRALALWAAIDSRRLDQAGRHMETAVTLAGLSRDGLVQHQVWRFASSLAIQRGNWIEATAANEAAALTSVHRRDPLYASLTNARLAVTLAKQEPARARRALDRAELAFGRADLAAHRPVAMEFYTRSELDGLLGVAHLHLGEPEAAEARFHRSIAGLRPEQHRNRAYYTVHAAQAQLRQRDIEQACATAATVIPPPWSTESGRIPHMLGGFTKQLRVTAPDASITREWLHQIRAAD